MSAGLMSCVRENSPPLEMGDASAISLPPDTPETQKRRRFHPLQKLRRIFRRRTVAHADTISPTNSIDDPNNSRLSARPNDIIGGTLSKLQSNHHHNHHQYHPGGGLISNSVSATGGFYVLKEKREHSADSPRSKEIANDLDRDMTDYQRSLSEGRLVDSEFNRDALSQSHDSVFSESATASSLSIVLKAELVDVLRKRRNRPDASDEDLGLPRSPITPQRKERTTMNQSEGSLSLLSMVSSEMYDESAPGLNNSGGSAHQSQLNNSSFASGKYSSSQFESSRESTDEVDLDMSISSVGSSRLSHSAARHKMAIRPKKKGPSRPHRKPIETTVLPSTPEVNEDSLRQSLLEIAATQTKSKSQSLPPGMNAKMIEKHATHQQQSTTTTTESTVSTTIVTKSTNQILSSTKMYVNKNLSKSYDFDKQTQQDVYSSSTNSTLERPAKDEDGGFFKRLLHRSSKKKKSVDEKDSPITRTIEISAEEETTKPSLNSMLNTYLPSNNELPADKLRSISSKIDKPRSGPASRQRVLPQEISTSPDGIKLADATVVESVVDETIEKLPPKSPKKLAPQSPADYGANKTLAYSPKPLNKFVFTPVIGASVTTTTDIKRLDEGVSVRETKYIKASAQNRNSDDIMSRFKKSSTEDSLHSISPPKNISWPSSVIAAATTDDGSRVRNSRVSNILSKIDAKTSEIYQSPRRKAVEKSKSFRLYNENITDNLQNSNNMPSLPDLSLSSAQKFDKPKFLGLKPIVPNKSALNSSSSTLLRGSREFSSNSDLKFEINDNNLIKSRDDDHAQNIFTKSIHLTGAKSTITTTSSAGNQNITQIEDNIDKIMKSSFVTVLKKSATNEHFEILKPRNNVSITSITPMSPTKDGKKDDVWFEPKKNGSTPTTPTSPAAKVETNNTTPTSSPSTPGTKMPEFMKIQLNRIEAGRPKSHVVLSKNSKETDAKERRFSNESVEITDYSKLSADSIERNALTKSEESVSSYSSSSKSPIKRSFDRNISSTSMTDITKARADTNGVVIERRKSVSDEKLKFEKKIEELRAEAKRSLLQTASDDFKHSDKKSSFDEENVVVLRKKSLSQSNNNNKEDTPELMKVFARRSLKIKDTDDYQLFEDEKSVAKPLKSGANVDSDKENQSSSEEKLDKIVKIEQTIKTDENGKKDSGSTEAFRKSNLITPKPFMTPNRFVNNYRNTSTFLELRKANNISTTIVNSTSVTTTLNNSTNNQSQQISGGGGGVVVVVPSTNNSISSEENNNLLNSQNGPNNNINNVNNLRHTINLPNNKTISRSDVREEAEFKGILQRRAEWEKRAQEAFK